MFLAELAPQARRVFEYLLCHPGQRIHRTELVDKSWADRMRAIRRGAWLVSCPG
ncbi:DUF6416 domain-containing protein [Streptomyces sp. NPDC001276]|uniref:DUF6416 domain-containing protein n=1 Tax=Streptomyces sp. NPDC001276 TaxID=3364555 RepID=UPI00367D577F